MNKERFSTEEMQIIYNLLDKTNNQNAKCGMTKEAIRKIQEINPRRSKSVISRKISAVRNKKLGLPTMAQKQYLKSKSKEERSEKKVVKPMERRVRTQEKIMYHICKQTRIYCGQPYCGSTSNGMPAQYKTLEVAKMAQAEFTERNPVGWNIYDKKTGKLVDGIEIYE